MKFLEKLKTDLIVRGREGYKKVVLGLLEGGTNVKLLDLGSGDYRRLTSKVADVVRALSITSVDLGGVPTMGRRDGRPYTHFRADLNNPLSFLGGKEFDVIIASQIIEHLWNTDGFLKEIHRVLKPTGYAIISTPNLAAWHNVLYLILGKQPEPAKVSEEMYPEHEKPGHLRVFTKGELVKLLGFHGFGVEKVVGSGYILGRPTTVTVKVRK